MRAEQPTVRYSKLRTQHTCACICATRHEIVRSNVYSLNRGLRFGVFGAAPPACIQLTQGEDGLDSATAAALIQRYETGLGWAPYAYVPGLPRGVPAAPWARDGALLARPRLLFHSCF